MTFPLRETPQRCVPGPGLPWNFSVMASTWSGGHSECLLMSGVLVLSCIHDYSCIHIYIYKHIRIWVFPECVARLPVSLWRCGGWALFARRCATVRNRLQVSAWGRYGRAYGKFWKRGHFWSFPASHSFISRGRRGTLWHFNIFDDVSKVVLCGRRDTFATFSDDALHFSWQAQRFGDLRCHFA